MRRLIVIAHPLEAEALKDYPELGKVIVSGMGSLAAAIATAKHALHYDAIWNLGVVGSLQEELELGAIGSVQSIDRHLVFPETTSQRAQDVSIRCHPTLSLQPKGWRLLSSDFPVEGRDSFGRSYDVVDMEGYGIASAAKAAGKPCELWKIVSDRCSDVRAVRERVPRLMKALLQVLASAPTSP